MFDAGGGRDRITDFEDGVDRVQLGGLAGVSRVEDALARARTVGADVVFDFGGGDALTVEGITKSQIADDLVMG